MQLCHVMKPNKDVALLGFKNDVATVLTGNPDGPVKVVYVIM